MLGIVYIPVEVPILAYIQYSNLSNSINKLTSPKVKVLPTPLFHFMFVLIYTCRRVAMVWSIDWTYPMIIMQGDGCLQVFHLKHFRSSRVVF